MGAKGGLKSVPDACLFCRQNETTFRQLRNGRFSPNSATTRESWVKCRIRTEIYEKFPFRGHFPPNTRNFEGSNRYLTQSRLQVKGYTAERYCFIPRCSPRAREFPISGQLFCTTYGCETMGLQSCPIFRFWPIFAYKTRKTYLPVTSLHPRDYIAE